MTSIQPTLTQGTPPPLPASGPGTGGREKLPSRRSAGSCAGRSPWRNVAIAAVWLVFIWTLTGAGHFWPVWLLVPVAAMMLGKGLHCGGRSDGHAMRCG